MKNSEISKLFQGLQKIYLDKSLKFDAITAFKLAKNRQALAPIYDSLEEKQKIIFDSYADKTITPPTILYSEIPRFQEKIDELMEQETKIQLNTISLEELKDTQLNMETIESLIPIIK